MFRDAAKRFASERAPVSQLRKLRDDVDADGFSRELWKEMADMGWAGVLVPEEHGGVGFGFVGAGLHCHRDRPQPERDAAAVERSTWR